MAKLDNVKVVNENTVEYNGFVYGLVTGDAQVNDLVKASEYELDVTEGAFYLITGIDCDGDIKFYDDDNDGNLFFKGKHSVFRKSHAITNDSLTDAEGVVTITLPDGTKLEGTPSDLESIMRKFQVAQEEQAPEEPVEVENEIEDGSERLQVGDYAKVIVHTDSRAEYGEIRKIVKTDDSVAPYNAETLDGSRTNWFNFNKLVRATEEEVKAATEPKEEPLKVGDYVKVVEEGSHGFKENDVIRIYDIVDYGSNRIRGEYLSGKRISCDYFYERELVKATDEEVLTAKQALLKVNDYARVIGGEHTEEA